MLKGYMSRQRLATPALVFEDVIRVTSVPLYRFFFTRAKCLSNSVSCARFAFFSVRMDIGPSVPTNIRGIDDLLDQESKLLQSTKKADIVKEQPSKSQVKKVGLVFSSPMVHRLLAFLKDLHCHAGIDD